MRNPKRRNPLNNSIYIYIYICTNPQPSRTHKTKSHQTNLFQKYRTSIQSQSQTTCPSYKAQRSNPPSQDPWHHSCGQINFSSSAIGIASLIEGLLQGASLLLLLYISTGNHCETQPLRVDLIKQIMCFLLSPTFIHFFLCAW